MTYEVKKINVGSLTKIVPIIFGIVGIVIGLFTFFLFPTEVAQGLAFGTRLLSWLIFIVLYTLIMYVGIVVISLLYNWVCGMMGGVVLSLDEKQS
jgi:uncharacterized protein YacL